MQINDGLNRALSAFVPHTASVPAVKRTPRPEKSKVVSVPVRAPVNKQAAMIIAPASCWLSKPLPEPKLPTREQHEIEKLRAELKSERNDHAATRDLLGQTRIELRRTRSDVARLLQETSRLKSTCQEQADTIRQLEDLRL